MGGATDAVIAGGIKTQGAAAALLNAPHGIASARGQAKPLCGVRECLDQGWDLAFVLAQLHATASPSPMTLGRFAILVVIGLVAAIAFKLTWIYWLLAAALVAVWLKLRGNG